MPAPSFKTRLSKLLKSGNGQSPASFKRTSYSQSGEDLIVDFIFTQIGIEKPTYIDIGAHHPYYLSNSAFFYEKGCRGINIEPDPNLFKEFVKVRKDDINVNCGAGAEEGALELNIMDVPTLNTFSKEEAERLVKENNFRILGKTEVKIETIQSILQKYSNGVFPDFMSLDVEGLDEVIIKSIDFKKTWPTVICLETISYSATGEGEKNTAIIDYLAQVGYMVYADTNINTIFVRKDKWVRGKGEN